MRDSSQSRSGTDGKKKTERELPSNSESDAFIYGTAVSSTAAKIYGVNSASLPTSFILYARKTAIATSENVNTSGGTPLLSTAEKLKSEKTSHEAVTAEHMAKIMRNTRRTKDGLSRHFIINAMPENSDHKRKTVTITETPRVRKTKNPEKRYAAETKKSWREVSPLERVIFPSPFPFFLYVFP